MLENSGMIKTKTARSAKYLEYVRTRPCAVTGMQGEGVVAHHIRCLGGGGMGMKPSDYFTVPLTNEEHTKLHAMGEKKFWAQHDIDPGELISMTLLIFIAQQKPDFRVLSAFAEILTNK